MFKKVVNQQKRRITIWLQWTRTSRRLTRAEGLKPSQKHKDEITEWPIPSSREELDGFLWLTLFPRIFVPGRAQLVMDMKKAYLELVCHELKLRLARDAVIEECDQDVTKKSKTPRMKKPTIRREWVEGVAKEESVTEKESTKKARMANQFFIAR